MSAAIMGRARGPRPSRAVLEWLTASVLAMPSSPKPQGPRPPPAGSIEARVLALLTDEGPASAARIADRTGIERQQVRNALYRMRDRDLIEPVDTERVLLAPPMPAVLRIVWAVRKHPGR